jgi:hypothetical protein
VRKIGILASAFFVAACFIATATGQGGGEIKGKGPDYAVAGWKWGDEGKDPWFFKANDDGSKLGYAGSARLKQPGEITDFELEVWVPSQTIPGGWVKHTTIVGVVNPPGGTGEWYFTYSSQSQDPAPTVDKDTVVTFEAFATVKTGPTKSRTFVARKTEKAVDDNKQPPGP